MVLANPFLSGVWANKNNVIRYFVIGSVDLILVTQCLASLTCGHKLVAVVNRWAEHHAVHNTWGPRCWIEIADKGVWTAFKICVKKTSTSDTAAPELRV